MAWKFSVLVVANVTATSPELLEALKERTSRDECAFTLLVPAPGSGKQGREAAEARVAEAVKLMRSEGLEVQGMVGDPDPIAAVHEVWDPMKYDEVVISTLPTGVSKWLQVDLPHRAEKITGVQVTHVVAEPPRPPVKTEPAPEPEKYGVLAPLVAAMGRRPRGDKR